MTPDAPPPDDEFDDETDVDETDADLDDDAVDDEDADAAEEEALDDLLDIVERAIETGQPIDVLGLASATLAIVLHPEPPVDVDRELIRDQVIENVVLRYVELGTPDSLTYAAALAGLIADEKVRRSLRAALDGADGEIPGWLAALDDARLEQPTVVRDLFDDDEWLLAGVRFSDGNRFAFRVEIDHDPDSAVANAMLMPTTVDEITQRLHSTARPDEVSITEVSPDDFWARYTEAVALADNQAEPPRTDTWPSCRPAIEWALRQTP